MSAVVGHWLTNTGRRILLDGADVKVKVGLVRIDRALPSWAWLEANCTRMLDWAEECSFPRVQAKVAWQIGLEFSNELREPTKG